jgi:putative Mg2+ transporter-C (MgtC) family protein
MGTHVMLAAALGNSHADPMESVLRLVLALVAGGLIGLDREIRGRQAGFRTNILVCLGSALVMIVSTHFALYPWQPVPGININVDPARIAYGVMTGVGFLGAGTIIHNHGSVRGLTTAAGMWCVAAIGLAVGFGLYTISAAAVLLVVGVLWLFDYIEELLPKQKYRTISLRAPYRPGIATQLAEQVGKSGLRVVDVTFERSANPSQADVHLAIVFTRAEQFHAIETMFQDESEVSLISVAES